MKSLVKKEIRLLLPAWGIAMLLAIVSPWFYSVTYSNADSLDFFFRLMFSAAVLLLGIWSFGQELNSGLFTILLSQPFERRRLWNTKITTLAVAFVFVWLAAIVSFLIRFHDISHFETNGVTRLFWMQYRTSTLEVLTLSSLVAFSGGLWTTLLLRQVTAAFWLTLLIPSALFFTVSLGSNYLPISDQIVNNIIVVILAVYSVAGFFWARRLFLHAQDIQWTGGEFSFTWRKETNATQSASAISRPRHWLSAVLWKEFQLQQINILIAIVILIFHLVAVFARKIHPHFTNQDSKFILETVWTFWLVLPLLIGSAAVAEERKLGVMESQLCLPLSRYAQLFIKFVFTLLLSLFFGACMPLLIEGTSHVNSWIYAGAAGIFFVSFYASTIVRTTLQAMGLAIGSIVVFYFFETATDLDLWRLGISPWVEGNGAMLTKIIVEVPILLLVLGSLAVWNFKWLHPGAKCWRRNLISVVFAFMAIFILTYTIYLRAWELLTPVDPPHGPARFETTYQPKFVYSDNTLYAALPDGRLWTETLTFQTITNVWGGQNTLIVPQKSRVQFISGTNWQDVACNDFQSVGIQSDGTLWSIQRKEILSRGRFAQTGTFVPTQIGSGADWSQVAAESMGFLLMKKDGSLWRWGTQSYDWNHGQQSLHKKLKQDLAEPPVSLGNDSKFTTLFSSGGHAYAQKDDGTVWQWTSWNYDKFASTLVEQTNLDSANVNFSYGGGDFLEIKADGQLWFTIQIGNDRQGKTRYTTQQLGVGEKWKYAVRSNWNSIIAIRDDNTLWQWSWWPGNAVGPHSAPTELGHDWIALARTWYGAFSLSSDGTLWAWDQPSKHAWLIPSRKPVYIANLTQDSPYPTPAAP